MQIMMPIGPLMIEHRLIERMIKIADKRFESFKNDKETDFNFINTLTDFLRTYADRCHHGKEENILFRELGKKKISSEHKKIMNELTEEHRLARATVGRLDQANRECRNGSPEAFKSIIESIDYLIEFYPKHIEKEDKKFFIPVMDYFSEEEKDAILQEGYEFDKGLIHEVYGDIVLKEEE
jgi:hemerythrin-like domain-containing protein